MRRLTGIARRASVWVLCIAVAYPSLGATETVLLPLGNRIYVATQQDVVGKKDQAEEGQMIPCQVWRDVVLDGRVVIRAGTPVLARIESVTKAKKGESS